MAHAVLIFRVSLTHQESSMFIHKIFHLHKPLEEARRTVTELGALRELAKNNARFDEDGTGHFEVKTKFGQRISADIRQVPGNEPNQLLFQSVGGDVELAGMIEFVPIRDNLTEVILTLDYEVASSFQRAFDLLTSSLDRFLNRQLTRLELYLRQQPKEAPRPSMLAPA